MKSQATLNERLTKRGRTTSTLKVEPAGTEAPSVGKPIRAN